MLTPVIYFIYRGNRAHQSQNILCSGYYHTLENPNHFKSADELFNPHLLVHPFKSPQLSNQTVQKSCRNYYCENSRTLPSICSMNSYRLKRHPVNDEISPKQHKIIEEFDLERIERERRKSHTDLFEKHHLSDLNLNFGTAV